MIWFLSALALAAPTERYPWQAEVELPASGVARITVPPELRSAEDPADGRDLLLVDAEGGVVPFAVLRGEAETTTATFVRGTEDSASPLVFWPDLADHTYWLRVSDRPINGVVVQLPDAPSAATVVISEDRDGTLVEVSRRVVWRLPEASELAVPVPPRAGLFQLVAVPHTPLKRMPGFTAVRHDGVDLADDTLRLPVRSALLQENGWTRYDVELPQRLPVDWLELDPAEDLFDRRASVQAPLAWTEPASMPPSIDPYDAVPIRRIQLAGATVDQARLNVPERHGRRLSVLVDSSDRAPLEIPDVVVGFDGQELVVRDAGPGPHTLYAGARTDLARPSDLQFATPELVRIAQGPVLPGARSDNPAHVPPELSGGLGLPGVPLERDRSTFARDVTGGAGLARVPLDLHVLTHARADLGDLRLVTADGAQIPYVLENIGNNPGWTDLPIERTERDGTSVLEVTLPEPNLLIATVTLHTEAPLFRRGVRVSVPRGGLLQPLRSFTWSGADRPSTLTLDLHRRIGNTLVVELDNGDDPPLPLHRIDADWPAWELIAVLPEGGAELRYGDLRRTRPAYDLWLVDDLTLRAEAPAEVDAVRALGPPPVAFLDRVAVLGGVGVLGLGLLVLTGLLIRGAEDEDEDDAVDGTDDTEPGPEDGAEDAAGEE